MSNEIQPACIITNQQGNKWNNRLICAHEILFRVKFGLFWAKYPNSYRRKLSQKVSSFLIWIRFFHFSFPSLGHLHKKNPVDAPKSHLVLTVGALSASNNPSVSACRPMGSHARHAGWTTSLEISIEKITEMATFLLQKNSKRSVKLVAFQSFNNGSQHITWPEGTSTAVHW